jgi:hypothetical protein
MQDEIQMIQAIRKHAEALYNKGWDYVVECWTDGDILEVLSDVEGDLDQAIKHLQSMVDIRNDQMAGHQAEAKLSY